MCESRQIVLRRGSTPLLVIDLPCTINNFSKICLSINQPRYTNIDIFESERFELLSGSDGELCQYGVRLTQDETLQLVAGLKTEIQLRFRTTLGDVWTSRMIEIKIEDVLRKGVI